MSAADCQCLTGTPVINADGSCGCETNNPCPQGSYLYNKQCIQDIQIPMNDGLPFNPFNMNRKKWNLTPPLQRPQTLATPAMPIAPNGYKYIWNGSNWVLTVDYDSNTTIYNQGRTTVGTGTGLTSAVSGLTSGIGSFIQNNQTIALLAAAGLLYVFVKGGGSMKPKSRVVTSESRY